MSYINKDEIECIIKKKWLEKYINEIFLKIKKDTNEIINKHIKEYKNKERIKKNDHSKPMFPAKELLNAEQIKLLPKWVQDEIRDAIIIWSSKKVIQISDGKKYHLDNKLNDLSGGEWTFFLNSVLLTRFTTSWEDSFAYNIRKIHPSPKPPQLMADIIKFFTKEWDIVFDYFMGVWGSLLWASLTWRKAVWIDLNQDYIDAYKKANKLLGLNEQVTIQWDSIKLIKWIHLDKYFKQKSKLILIDPPYWDMMARKKTWEVIKKWKSTTPTPFTDLKEDLWNMDREFFRMTFKDLVKESLKYLENKWHVVVFLKDIQPQSWKTNLWHADVINDLNKIKWLNYLWTKIRADQGVNLYPYWYPYSYVSNQIHQYIMIFKKD